MLAGHIWKAGVESNGLNVPSLPWILRQAVTELNDVKNGSTYRNFWKGIVPNNEDSMKLCCDSSMEIDGVSPTLNRRTRRGAWTRNPKGVATRMAG